MAKETVKTGYTIYMERIGTRLNYLNTEIVAQFTEGFKP